LGTTEEPEGLFDSDVGAEALDGDIGLGEDGELEGVSVDDKEMKDPEADDDELADLPGSRTSLDGPGYLPDDLFVWAAAATAIMAARLQKPTCGRALELYGYSDLSTNLGSHLLRDTNHT